MTASASGGLREEEAAGRQLAGLRLGDLLLLSLSGQHSLTEHLPTVSQDLRSDRAKLLSS